MMVQTNTLSFSSIPSHLRFAPRLGTLKLIRPESSSTIDIETPAFTVSTSRGVVPHLSRDHVQKSPLIRWVHIPFESFLDHAPPVPTLQPGEHPLHTFLGLPPRRHILSMSLRDPVDGRELPPNGNDYISAYCVRGVRKVTRSAWRSYVQDCRPDVVIALSDTPFTPIPHSQKRLTKSIQRSLTWLIDMFRPGTDKPLPPNVLVHMAGGPSDAARAAFSESLLETLHDKDATDCHPLTCLNDGLSGYLFDLAPLRSALSFTNNHTTIDGPPFLSQRLLSLIKASLKPLSIDKLRIVNTANSPHEMLIFILHIGIDLFDSQWAQEAAHHGVALDFQFPVPDDDNDQNLERTDGFPQPARKRAGGLLDLGHNLYDPAYAQDFSMLANNNFSSANTTKSLCECAACSPTAPAAYISHSAVDDHAWLSSSPDDAVRPFTRAYLHHLLHTHEMSAHTLLTLHNIQVLADFFTGVRSLLACPEGKSRFPVEVERFLALYDEGSHLLAEGTTAWKAVDIARGKGRLARENAAQELESTQPENQQTALGQETV